MNKYISAKFFFLKPCKKVAEGSVTFAKANRHVAKRRRDDLLGGQFIANLSILQQWTSSVDHQVEGQKK